MTQTSTNIINATTPLSSTTEIPGGGGEDGADVGLIIGSVFGAIAGLAALGAAAYFLFMFFKRKRQSEGSYNPAEFEVEQRRPRSIPLPNPERLI